jgi:hypothetical protein
VAERAAQLRGEIRQQDTPLGEFLALDELWKELTDDRLIFQPVEKGVVGFESKDFLQNGQAQNFTVVEFGSGSGTMYKFAIASADAGKNQGVIDRAVQGQDGVFDGKTCNLHIDSPCVFPHMKHRQVPVEK